MRPYSVPIQQIADIYDSVSSDDGYIMTSVHILIYYYIVRKKQLLIYDRQLNSAQPAKKRNKKETALQQQ